MMEKNKQLYILFWVTCRYIHGLEGFRFFFLQYVLISMSVMEGKSWDISHHQTAIVSVFETCWWLDGRRSDMSNPKWRMLNINLGARDSHRWHRAFHLDIRKEHRLQTWPEIFGSWIIIWPMLSDEQMSNILAKDWYSQY